MASDSAPGSPPWRADHRLDTAGLRCPEPLMLLRKAVRGMADGERIHVVTTDPASVRDFEQFCRFLRHRLVERSEDGERLDFLIEKGGGTG